MLSLAIVSVWLLPLVEKQAAKVIAVHEGDILTVSTANQGEVKLRVEGIDAPEERQPWHVESKKWMSDRVSGKVVEFKITGKDEFGRPLGRIFLNGNDIGLQSIETGMSWWCRKSAPADGALRTAETLARKEKVGLWSERIAIAPWDWRKGIRKSEGDRNTSTATEKGRKAPVQALTRQENGTRRAPSTSAGQRRGPRVPSVTRTGNRIGGQIFVTETGKRYHSGGCRTLKNSRIPINIAEAKAAGFTPCGICKPF